MKMQSTVVSVKADYMLELLVPTSIFMPHSGQGRLQFVIPFEEYSRLVRLMCVKGMPFYPGIVGLKQYADAVQALDKGNQKKLQYYFAYDVVNAGLVELKKSVSRKKDCTIICSEFPDAEYYSLNSVEEAFTMRFQKDASYNTTVVHQSMVELNKGYNCIPIDLANLSRHNLLYYEYLLSMYTMCQRIREDGFNPFNITQ